MTSEGEKEKHYLLVKVAGKINDAIMKDKGLGDTIARATKATGINALVKAVTKDCGCKKRQEKLNNMFPYGRTNQKNRNRP